MYNDFFYDKLNQLKRSKAQADALRAREEAATSLSSQLGKLEASRRPNSNIFTNIIGGIGEKLEDLGETTGNIIKTGAGWIGKGVDELSGNTSKRIMEDDSKRRNEIARRYGYDSYSQAVNDENASQDFWNEVNKSTGIAQDKLRKRQEWSKAPANIGNVRDIDLNRARGQALSTIGTATDVIMPGVAGNVISGAVEGVGDAFKNAQGGGQVDTNEALARGLAGGASGLVGGKLGSKLGGSNSILGRTAKSALTGAASGATTGAIMQGATGGDVLGGAMQGALAGAQGGALMGGANALGTKALSSVGNKLRGIEDTPVEVEDSAIRKAVEPMDAVKRQDLLDNLDDLKRAKSEIQSRDQFGFQDVYARRENYSKSLPEAFRSLQEAGLNDRTEMRRAAEKLGGRDGTLPKARREVLSNVGRIKLKVKGGVLDEQVLREIAGNNGVTGKDVDAFVDSINAIVGTRAKSKDLNKMITAEVDALDADDILRSIETLSKSNRAKNGSTSVPTPQSRAYDAVSHSIADELDNLTASKFGDFIKNSDNVEKIVAPIAKRYPKYADYVRGRLANSKSLSEARNILQDLTIVGKADQNAKMNINSAPSTGKIFTDELSKNISPNPVTLAKGVARAGIKAKQARGASPEVETIDKQIAKIEKQLGGEVTNNEGAMGKILGLKQKAKAGLEKAKAFDRLGADEDYMDESRSLGDLASTLATMNNRYGLDTLSRIPSREVADQIVDDKINQQIDAEKEALMDNYNAQYGAQAPMMAEPMQENPFGGQMQMLANGMQNALAAGDVKAYAQMANLLGEAQKLQAMQAKLSGVGAGAPELSAAQQGRIADLNNSLSSLDTLEKSFANAGGAQGFGGNLSSFANAVTGGAANRSLDSYNRLRDSIGAGIAKNLVNLGVTKEDMEAYLALLPKVTDSPEQAAQNLQTLRDLINDAKANVTSIR